MLCTHCGAWELAGGDLVCSWCGATYLCFTMELRPAALSTEDYPPPVALCVRNDSPMGEITLQTIESSRGWASLLPNQALPQRLNPGAQHVFLLDVDTFAPESEGEVTITVSVLYGSAVQSAVLHVRPPEVVTTQASERKR